MKFGVNISVNGAIARNINPGTVRIEVDTLTLSNKQREELCSIPSWVSGGCVYLKRSSANDDYLEVEENTPEALIAMLDGRIKKREDAKAEKQWNIDKEIRALRAFINDPKATDKPMLNYANSSENPLRDEHLALNQRAILIEAERFLANRDPKDFGYYATQKANLLPENYALRIAYFDEKESVEEEKRAAEAAIQAEADAKEKVKGDERLAWISQHGSPRLQRMVKEGIAYTGTYQDERLAFERPGWKWYENVDGMIACPVNPPMEAFEMLDEARKSEPKAELVYIKGSNPPKFAAYVEDFLGNSIVFGWVDAENEED